MIEDVIKIIKKAGKKTLEIYKTDFNSNFKKDNSPVTIADFESEKILINGLKKYNYKIVSEEAGIICDNFGNDNVFWVIDPLDGTKDFIQKTDDFSIMISLIKNNNPILAFIYIPTKDELFFAEINKGSFLIKNSQKKRLFVNKKLDIKNLNMVISRNHFKEIDKNIALDLGINNFKKMGSVGVKYANIVNSNADLCIYTTNYLGIWDCSAPHLLLTESNGLVFDINGKIPTYSKDELKMKNGFIGTIGFKKEILNSIKINLAKKINK
jgi:3'(2'), 5'-bisphosphate nucleotidase